MFENFTDKAKRIIRFAHNEAERLNSEYTGTEHILLGLLIESGVSSKVLKKHDVDAEKVRQGIERIIAPSNRPSIHKPELTPVAKRALQYSLEEARSVGQDYVGAEHVFLGLLRERDGIAAQVLLSLNLDLDELSKAILDEIGAKKSTLEPDTVTSTPNADSSNSRTPALDSFGRDLTSLAKEGKLDPVIGRETEIARVLQILCRRRKNQVCIFF